MSFESQTDYYDKRVESIDKKICELISQRKLISSNPGCPTSHHIASWSNKYNLNEQFLSDVFDHLSLDEMYNPIVEPKGFIKNISVLKSYESSDVFSSVPVIHQYENASIVHLNIDKDITKERKSGYMHQFSFIELSIEGNKLEYDCRNEQVGSSGSEGHISFDFIVSPPLPDDTSTIKLMFKEYEEPFKKMPTGLEFVITLDK